MRLATGLDILVSSQASLVGLVSRQRVATPGYQVEDDAGRHAVLFAHGDSTFWASTVDAVRIRTKNCMRPELMDLGGTVGHGHNGSYESRARRQRGVEHAGDGGWPAARGGAARAGVRNRERGQARVLGCQGMYVHEIYVCFTVPQHQTLSEWQCCVTGRCMQDPGLSPWGAAEARTGALEGSEYMVWWRVDTCRGIRRGDWG